MADGLNSTHAGPGSSGCGGRQTRLQAGTVLCDGAMGTMLYARGVFINRCYDELNLSQPELVREIHAEYLQAGAEVIETNTFGGNRFRLGLHGLQDKVREINVAGVALAREMREPDTREAGLRGVRAASIGPLGVRLEPLGKGRAG